MGVGTRTDTSCVTLVHGTMCTPSTAWRQQMDLAPRWHLATPARRGYREADADVQEDFRRDGLDLAALLDSPTHLVAHSYGCIGALVAARMRPEAVLSLTLVEPTFYGLEGCADIDKARHELETHFKRVDLSHREFLSGFLAALNISAPLVPDPMPAKLAKLTTLLRNQVSPWTFPEDAIVPWGGGRTLIISGGHDRAFDAICDLTAKRLGATITTLEGAGHSPQNLGQPFNALVQRFWRGEPLLHGSQE